VVADQPEAYGRDYSIADHHPDGAFLRSHQAGADRNRGKSGQQNSPCATPINSNPGNQRSQPENDEGQGSYRGNEAPRPAKILLPNWNDETEAMLAKKRRPPAPKRRPALRPARLDFTRERTTVAANGAQWRSRPRHSERNCPLIIRTIAQFTEKGGAHHPALVACLTPRCVLHM